MAWEKRAVIDGDTQMAYALINTWIENHIAENFLQRSTFGRRLGQHWIFEHPFEWLGGNHFRRHTFPEDAIALCNLLPWSQFIKLLYQLLHIADENNRKTTQ
jgi:hypothetical protein